ncbi:cilia- and flagella-associated protein 299-like isoform X2 [Halichondria panicea]|uniref:cilia- and flagella-associated protein 299-like isoform X2 n=1 Tax=Halichondria panicea TaxID=6063 RepID=UPI00312B3833
MAATGEEASNSAADTIVTEYATYEDYLDSQITPTDLFYLEDEELARQLVELGYRGSGEVLKREDFELRKEAAAASKLARRDQLRVLCSAGKDLQGSVFLEGLAQREETNRNGKISVDDFDPIFSSRKKLLPRHSDLSFYNWDTNFSSSNSTPNYQVIADNASGLLFKNKRDRKIINVDPKVQAVWGVCVWGVCMCVWVCVWVCCVCGGGNNYKLRYSYSVQ